LENIMLRTIGGILTASLAAPYLASFFIFVLMAVFSGSTDTEVVFGMPSHLDRFLDLLKFLIIGTFGAMMFGLPIIFGAGVLAYLLHLFALNAKRHAIASGSGIGCVSLALLFGRDPNGIWIFLLSGLSSGAICGWIYWRIALRGQTEQP
jgi:hypothetical protein